MPLADEPIDERAAAKAAVLPRLTDEFLETVTLDAIAIDGQDQAEGIAITLTVLRDGQEGGQYVGSQFARVVQRPTFRKYSLRVRQINVKRTQAI